MMVKQHMLFTLYSICGIVLKGKTASNFKQHMQCSALQFGGGGGGGVIISCVNNPKHMILDFHTYCVLEKCVQL